MSQAVRARSAQGLNMSLIPGGPKWTIRCGRCPATFRARIGHIDSPTVRCPSCGTWNELTGLEWTSAAPVAPEDRG